MKPVTDPLRDDPVAAIDSSCVSGGNCSEVAVLCPSFCRADAILNPNGRDRFVAPAPGGHRRLQRRRDSHRVTFA